jgi:amidophosphoribosyltransferase
VTKMCGILGLLLADEDAFVNQALFDGLTVLQHRGQDAAGIVTADKDGRLHLRKDNGLVKDVFQTHHMTELVGNIGLGHCRYPTAGSSSCAEAQPLYTNHPYGMCVVHNGNLTNTEALRDLVRERYNRHINTGSDSEVLLNVVAEELSAEIKGPGKAKGEDMASIIFAAMGRAIQTCEGGYAGLYLINGVGLVAVRDPHGIRPLVFGTRKNKLAENGNKRLDYCFASESVAIDTLGFNLERDVGPGEVIFVDMRTGVMHSKVVYENASLSPCIFEYVYFARPDSIMDGVSVYESRLKMGELLAAKILKKYPEHDIDVVIPIPDTSRTSALQAAYMLGRPFREGFIKNRYIARTFIMPGQETRKKSVRLKLNTIKSEFAGRNVLLVDDSVVRGTTAKEIVQMAREAGANKVYLTSAAPPIRYPNIYGIDIPTRNELIAFERNEEEIAERLGSDWIVYQDLADLEESVRDSCEEGKTLEHFDTSCFSGTYVTGEKPGDKYFQRLHELRNDEAQHGIKPGFNASSCESMSNDISKATVDAEVACEILANNTAGS